MGLFSRKSKQSASSRLEDDEKAEGKSADSGSSPDADAKKESQREAGMDNQPKGLPDGPLDISQIAEDKLSDYADFGVFMVPVIPGLVIHPDSPMNENNFGSLTMQYGKAAVELLAVAAPKSQRLWGDLRKEIRGETTKQGNTCEERNGSFGTELLAQLAVQTANGQHGHVQVRYCGVDGPNWFVRLVFNGVVSPEDTDLQALEKAVKSLVVVRGSNPMTPRSIIPVVLPDELTRQLAQMSQAQQA